MRFFWTLFWTFLLVQMLTYVVSSMTGIPYRFETGAIMAVAVTILLLVIPQIIPNEPAEKDGLH